MKNHAKLIKISQKRYEIQKKMDIIADHPVKMAQFKQAVRNIKTSQRKHHCGAIENNITIAQNWGTFEKIKHERLTSANRINTSLVIKKKKKIEKLIRKKRIGYQHYWEKKKIEV